MCVICEVLRVFMSYIYIYYINNLNSFGFIIVENDCLTWLIEKLKPRNSKVSSEVRISHFICVEEVSSAIFLLLPHAF